MIQELLEFIVIVNIAVCGFVGIVVTATALDDNFADGVFIGVILMIWAALSLGALLL